MQKLAEQMMKSSYEERGRLRKSLDGLSAGRSLAGCIFEIGVHEALVRGQELKPRPLQDYTIQSLESIKIQMNIEPDVFEMKSLSPSAVTRGPYHKPKLKMFESINSFYLPKKEGVSVGQDVTAQEMVAWNEENLLILFQMAVSITQPVNASRIIDVLERLGLLESVKTDPQRMALGGVFVVPTDIASHFKRQTINKDETDGTQSIRGLKHIGPKAAKTSERRNIYSIDALKSAIRDKTLPPSAITRRALQSLEGMRDRSYSTAIEQIPQYVCTWSG